MRWGPGSIACGAGKAGQQLGELQGVGSCCQWQPGSIEMEDARRWVPQGELEALLPVAEGRGTNLQRLLRCHSVPPQVLLPPLLQSG